MCYRHSVAVCVTDAMAQNLVSSSAEAGVVGSLLPTKDDSVVDASSFELLKVIGKGTYGKVRIWGESIRKLS